MDHAVREEEQARKGLSIETLEDLLSSDHEAIDGLMASLAKALDSGAAAARPHGRAMTESLVHHMEWEETVLFPAVPPSPRMSGRHVESLLIDHERIRRSLGDLQEALDQERVSGARAALDDLRVFLAGHNGDEEVGIYREADRVLGEGVKQRMARSFVTSSGPASPGP